MKSPITGKDMKLQAEERQLTFRKEDFSIVYLFYLCEDSGEKFTTTKVDELNMQQLYNLYRDKHNITFPEEIKEIRNKYGISAKKMSEVLGLGVNSYRNYENGEVPNHSNSKLIQMAQDPRNFKDLVELSDLLSERDKAELTKKADRILAVEKERKLKTYFEEYLLNGLLPDVYTGFKKSNFEKLTEMVVFFTQELSPWKTAMNKLLFYSDFGFFKNACRSISGARYRAITWGPVPDNFNSIFDYIKNNGSVNINYIKFPNGVEGEQFIPIEGRNFNAGLFDKNEIEILNKVAARFRDVPTQEIVETSHKEKAWIENQTAKNLISYQYAFALSES